MSEITKALLDAGVGNDLISETPDGLVRVTTPDGYHMTMGYDDRDADGAEWWTATRYDADGTEQMTDSWQTPDEMAIEVAGFAKLHAA